MKTTLMITAIALLMACAQLPILNEIAPADLSLQTGACTPGNFASFQCYSDLV